MAGEGAKNIAIIVLFVFAIAMTAIALEAYNKANLDKEGGGRKTTKTFLIAMLVILSVGLLVTAFFLFKGGSESAFVTEASQNMTAASTATTNAYKQLMGPSKANLRAQIAELQGKLNKLQPVTGVEAGSNQAQPPPSPAGPAAGAAAGPVPSGGS